MQGTVNLVGEFTWPPKIFFFKEYLEVLVMYNLNLVSTKEFDLVQVCMVNILLFILFVFFPL